MQLNWAFLNNSEGTDLGRELGRHWVYKISIRLAWYGRKMDQKNYIACEDINIPMQSVRDDQLAHCEALLDITTIRYIEIEGGPLFSFVKEIYYYQVISLLVAYDDRKS